MCTIAAACVVLASCESAGSSAPPLVTTGGESTPSQSAPTTTTPSSRVLLVGDSTLLAVGNYKAFGSLRDVDYVYDAESCRTLGIESCGKSPKPLNTVETILDSDGTFDAVVVMAGYDEWWTSFPSSFDKVVAAARAKGAAHVLWLTYREDVTYENPDGIRAAEAYVKNNATLREKVALTEYSDVTLLDWNTYSASEPGWLEQDGIHLTRQGAHAVADYISRMVAHIDGRRCPGDDSTTVCPNPDTVLIEPDS